MRTFATQQEARNPLIRQCFCALHPEAFSPQNQGGHKWPIYCLTIHRAGCFFSDLHFFWMRFVMERKSAHKIQVGHRYGNWVIIGEVQRIGGDMRYLCQCGCGTEKLVSAITLRNGSSTSCGCMRKEKPPRISDFELQPTPADIQEIFNLISQGCLPPADQFSIVDGAPSWTLPAIAKILGIGRSEFIQHIEKAGPRFSTESRSAMTEAYSATT